MRGFPAGSCRQRARVAGRPATPRARTSSARPSRRASMRTTTRPLRTAAATKDRARRRPRGETDDLRRRRSGRCCRARTSRRAARAGGPTSTPDRARSRRDRRAPTTLRRRHRSVGDDRLERHSIPVNVGDAVPLSPHHRCHSANTWAQRGTEPPWSRFVSHTYTNRDQGAGPAWSGSIVGRWRRSCCICATRTCVSSTRGSSKCATT